MPKPKEQILSDGRVLHFSAGAVIERGGKYLLIDRKNKPLGFASLAGHIDEGETPRETIEREIREESGLQLISCKEIVSGRFDKTHCVHGVAAHAWHVFRCEVQGRERIDQDEAKSIGWYTSREMQNLNLEPSWKYWFERLGIISL